MNIYQYDNYRQYLKDRFDQKTAVASFSWRKFSRGTGISNPGFINDVIKGRRGLSRHAAVKVARYLSLPPHEADFFNLLVAFAHAKKITDKDCIYRKIAARRSRSAFAQVNPERVKYYQDYRYPLVRCALMAAGGHGEPSRIAKFCRPMLPVSVVKRIIGDLCRWGLAKTDNKGSCSVTDKFVTPSRKLTAQVRLLNREWIRQAGEALETLNPDERYIASQLLCMSSGLRDEIRKKMESFRNEVWEMVRKDKRKADCIMLLNTQFVPKSGKGKLL